MFSLTRHLICLVLYLYLFCICICICLVWHATLFVFLAALSRFLRRVPGQKQKKRENTSQSFGHNKIKFTSCLVVKLATYLYLFLRGDCQDENRRKGQTQSFGCTTFISIGSRTPKLRHKSLVTIKKCTSCRNTSKYADLKIITDCKVCVCLNRYVQPDHYPSHSLHLQRLDDVAKTNFNKKVLIRQKVTQKPKTS